LVQALKDALLARNQLFPTPSVEIRSYLESDEQSGSSKESIHGTGVEIKSNLESDEQSGPSKKSIHGTLLPLARILHLQLSDMAPGVGAANSEKVSRVEGLGFKGLCFFRV
jgi:hypothetical protein